MNNPATIKRRKRLRIARHKREAVRYHEYTHSEKFEDDMIKGFKEIVDEWSGLEDFNRPLDKPIVL